MKLSFLVASLAPVLAFSTGSPICNIDETAISRMGPQEKLGYSVNTKSNPDGSFTFSLSNAKLSDFKGILIYVVSASSPSTHLGKFTFSDSKFKECSSGVASGSTLTHANPNSVPLSTVFTWTGSLSDLAKSDLVVRAVVATYAHGQSSGPANWEHLVDTPFKSSLPPTTAIATAGISSTLPPITPASTDYGTGGGSKDPPSTINANSTSTSSGSTQAANSLAMTVTLFATIALAAQFNVTLEELNDYLCNHPIDNSHFGLSRHLYIDSEINRLVPARMVTYGKEKVAGLLYEWIKWNSDIGGRMTTSQGSLILDERMSEVAYTPRNIDRNLSHKQQWTYQGEPFAPTSVVEIDTLSGSGYQRRWLIDPKNKIMIVYKKNAVTGIVDVSADDSWKNLSGDDILPGFVIESLDLDLVLDQGPGSSSEDELEEPECCRRCNLEFKKDSEMAKHAEWHRSQAQKAKFLRNQQH
ncbi:hypothetical protein HDV04_004751 [Boothiomyces sp. JEL0838]|nr:hypothetical protein HDV04_004751 [Boothiomyces sp. JEL0838]